MANNKDTATFVFQATHRIVYSTANPVPLKEVIHALQGLEGLLMPLPKMLSGLTGIQVQGCEFLIERIESGSLIEDIVVRFLFKDKTSLDAFIDRLSENRAVKTTIITLSIAALTAYGLHLAVGNNPAPVINATHSLIIQNGAGQLNIHPDAFSAAMALAAPDKKALAENALRFLGPARADPKADIDFGGGLVTIPHAAVVEAPTRLAIEPNERWEEFTAIPLTLRATNLDSKKSGWAGRLGNRDERLPVVLDPSVNETELFGRKAVAVDAALIYKEQGRSRELKPARIYVRRISPST